MIHGVYTGGALLLSPQGLLLRGELLGEDLVVLPTDGDEEAFLVQITTAVAPSLDQVFERLAQGVTQWFDSAAFASKTDNL